nr:putative ribonuclease H-like domain-containing protein [Tanacetum cinerariifolium]
MKGNQPNHNADPQKTDADAAFDVKDNETEVHVSPRVRDLSDEFKEFFVNNTNRVNAASAPVTAVGLNSTNSTYSFNVAGLSNNAGHTQEEDIDYEEVFAPVARIEAIRLFLAYASFMGFMVYQMDVKSAFLYGTIKEEVYVCQPLGFKDSDYLDKVYKVDKALYGLHQAPRAWYETLANYLLENGFQRGKIDQTLFIKKQKGDILLVQVYVDDIIFGSTNKELCKAFEKLMKDKFQMSSIGEITFFLGLHVKKKDNGIFISQDKYVAKILRKFGLTDGKLASTSIDTEKPLLKDPDGEDMDVYIYRNSTTEGCQFLGCRLISCQCKKQTVVTTSSTEAEYVAAESCCAQVLWIQNQLLDYRRMHPNRGKIAELDANEDVTPVDVDAKDTDEAEPTEVEEVLEVVTAAKLMTEVVTTAAPITTAAQVPKASALRRRRGVVIQDPEKTATSSVIVHLEVQSKDKGKGILIEEPKPLKGQSYIDMDEAFTRQLEAELNANINWNDVIEQVKRREKQYNTVMRYQALKRKPVAIAQAKKIMMIYLKNMAGFKMDFFKGMTYCEIRPIFEKHYNSIQAFLEKGDEEVTIQEEGSKRKGKSLEKI